MTLKISASDAKNNFGGLLEQVSARGRVDITKHGRVVAVILSPRLLDSGASSEDLPERWGETHMIPRRSALRARMVPPPVGFDDP